MNLIKNQEDENQVTLPSLKRKDKSSANLFPFCKLNDIMLSSIKHQNSAKVSWYFILISDNKEFDSVDDDEQDAI